MASFVGSESSWRLRLAPWALELVACPPPVLNPVSPASSAPRGSSINTRVRHGCLSVTLQPCESICPESVRLVPATVQSHSLVGVSERSVQGTQATKSNRPVGEEKGVRGVAGDRPSVKAD
eukprot:scaffold112618_cov30-Tisochrysis_lutea.AAC.5